MVILHDKHNLINIHPLIVYFILNEEEELNYRSDIMRLGRYLAYNRGMFKFRVVKRTSDTNFDLPEKLRNAFADNNMFMRLIDSPNGGAYYAMQHVDFTADGSEIETTIHNFVTEVCKCNHKKIKQQMDMSLNDPERRKALESIHNALKKATDVKVQANAWSRHRTDYSSRGGNEVIFASLYQVASHYNEAPLQEIPTSAIALLKEQGISSHDAPRIANRMWELFTETLNAPDDISSARAARSALDGEFAKVIKRKKVKQTPPAHDMNIKVEVKEVTRKTTKNGTAKKSYGVAITVDDKTCEIYLGGNPQTFLYIATLIRHKNGEPFYIHEIYNNSKGTKSSYKREKSKPWLTALYNELLYLPETSFSKWADKVKEQHGRTVSQGKSNANSAVTEALGELNPALYYCLLTTKEDKLGDSYYTLNIDPDNIVIPHKIEELCRQYTTMK